MALALDPSGGFNNIFSAASSGSVTFSTTNASTLVVVCACEVTSATGAHRTVSSVSDNSGTTGAWSCVPGGITTAPKAYLDNSGAVSAYNTLEIWACNAPSAITSKSITVTFNNTVDDAVLIAFGINGTDTTTPFDQNAALAAIGAYTSGFTNPTVSGVNTTSANTCMLAVWQSTSNTDAGTPSGFTRISYRNNGGGANNCEAAAAYQLFSAARSGDTYTAAAAGINGWTMIAVALKDPGGAAPTPKPSTLLAMGVG